MSSPAPQFQAVLESNQLNQAPRDLRFHPTVNPSPKAMTPEQVEDFNRDGFVKPFTIFSTEEITQIRQYFDDLLKLVTAQGGDSYSISSAHLKYGKVHDIVTNPKIVALVSDLLGENVIGWGSHFFCKMPHDGKAVSWHQDASYWPLTPSKAVTVWLAIDDADTENACMNFIAGSHYSGHLTYKESSPEEHNVLNQTVEDPLKYGTFVADELKAGQVSLHSDLLLHGSEANDSNRRRCGLTIRYAAAEVRAGLNWNQKGVWVKGEDPSQHWNNLPRPAQD